MVGRATAARPRVGHRRRLDFRFTGNTDTGKIMGTQDVRAVSGFEVKARTFLL